MQQRANTMLMIAVMALVCPSTSVAEVVHQARLDTVADLSLQPAGCLQVVSRKSMFIERTQDLARSAAGHDGSFHNR